MASADDALLLTKSLYRDLNARQPDIDRYNDYYDGKHRLAFASEKFRNAFGGMFREFADNWCDLVPDAVEERLNVEGFRFGIDSDTGDRDAWRMWQANSLDAESQLAHTEALVTGEGFVMVGPNADDEANPLITVESSRECYVRHAPGNRRRRVAGIKSWQDGRKTFVNLITPEFVWKWQGTTAGGSVPVLTPREERTEPWPAPNPLGIVNLVPLRNRPRLGRDGVSEIKRVVPMQDAVNKLVADMLVASEFSAFRQRWVTGMEIPTDPITNMPVEPFKAAVDRLWIGENPETKFGEFGETSLANYAAAIELIVQHIASQTRTPPHYFALTGQFPSGESIKSAETGLVAKVRRKQRHFGESWEEVIRLAFLASGNPERAAALDAEVIWGDPESRSESEHIDALTKKRALGVPLRQLWEDAGYSPQQIERFRTMRDEEAQQGALSDLTSIAGEGFAATPPAG